MVEQNRGLGRTDPRTGERFPERVQRASASAGTFRPEELARLLILRGQVQDNSIGNDKRRK